MTRRVRRQSWPRARSVFKRVRIRSALRSSTSQTEANENRRPSASSKIHCVASLASRSQTDCYPASRLGSVNTRLAPCSELVSEPEIVVAIHVLVYQVSATRVSRVFCIRDEVLGVTEVNRDPGASIRVRIVVVNSIILARPHAGTGRPKAAIIRAADVDSGCAVVVC
jgi:hypothetical protein